MMDQTTTTPATDARFLDVLRTACAVMFEETGEGRNGELYIEREDRGEWLGEVVDTFLREAPGPLRAMLDARARLGENVRLVEDIDVERIRTQLDDVPVAILVERLDALLDFVAEIRKIAKEI
jgi:hypothetical protein